MTPWWFQLLKALRQEPRIAREGSPTVAFLVGAIQPDLTVPALTEEAARETLTQLVFSVVNEMPTKHMVHITRCSVLGQPVVRPLPAGLAVYHKHGLTSEVQKRRTVVLDEEFADHPQASIDYVSGCLFKNIGPDLCAGRFSFEKGHYRPLDAYERDFILGTLS